MDGEFHRSALVIQKKFYENELADAIVVMMNPGSSSPEDDSQLFESYEYPRDLVACYPDDTQYQISYLMDKCNWNKVVVLNLSDKCEPDSNKIYNSFKKGLNISTIFHDSRINELNSIFESKKESGPVIIGWGVNDKLKIVKQKALSFLVSRDESIVGWLNAKNDYYHPWPRKNLEIRMNWPSHVYNELIDNNCV